MFPYCYSNSTTLPLLRRAEAMPSLDACWEPPPHFGLQRDGTQAVNEPGLNAEWRVDFCTHRRRGLAVPTLSARAWARVRHAHLCLEEGWLAPRVRVPLVHVSFVEMDALSQTKQGWWRARLRVKGRGLFRMVMFLSAQSADELLAIRDWLRFLVVRQRIPHLVLGLQFEWEKGAAEQSKRHQTMTAKCGRWTRTLRDYVRTSVLSCFRSK